MRSGGRPFGWLLFSLLLTACSDDSVEGTWCGKDVAAEEECVGDDVHYVTLTQSGDSVGGSWCEAYGADDCTQVDAALDGDTMRMDGFGKDSRTIELHLDGDVLDGVMHGCSTCDSGPCLCDLPVTLHRL